MYLATCWCSQIGKNAEETAETVYNLADQLTTSTGDLKGKITSGTAEINKLDAKINAITPDFSTVEPCYKKFLTEPTATWPTAMKQYTTALKDHLKFEEFAEYKTLKDSAKWEFKKFNDIKDPLNVFFAARMLKIATLAKNNASDTNLDNTLATDYNDCSNELKNEMKRVIEETFQSLLKDGYQYVTKPKTGLSDLHSNLHESIKKAKALFDLIDQYLKVTMDYTKPLRLKEHKENLEKQQNELKAAVGKVKNELIKVKVNAGLAKTAADQSRRAANKATQVLELSESEDDSIVVIDSEL